MPLSATALINTARTNVEQDLRICKLCNEDIETEAHFMFQCKRLDSPKKDVFLNHIKTKLKNVQSLSTENKFIFLIGVEEDDTCRQIAKYLFQMLDLRKFLRSVINCKSRSAYTILKTA